MLNNRKLILDTFCEVYDLLNPLADGKFWALDEHEIIPGAIYLIGRQQFTKHVNLIKQLALDNIILPILSNPAEGSDTMRWQIMSLGIMDLVKQGKILVVTGGDLPSEIPAIYYENFLPKILDYDENILASTKYQNDSTNIRPYKFLFLNGRARPHRKYLIEKFKINGLLEQSIWTNLDTTLAGSRSIQLLYNNQDLLLTPGNIKLLDKKYEFDFYQTQCDVPNLGFIKYNLFNGDWGEIYIKPDPYLDTYFSLITETVFEYPYSFRTEKIWKPICVGHPFVVASNVGYYRDLHNIGFKTFNHLIDESFDTLDNNQERIERVAQVVEDLCRQDLPAFLAAAEETCKYNQQHLAEMRTKVRKEFPQRFINFINERPRI